MRFLFALISFTTYFVEWIPNTATAPAPYKPEPPHSPGEFPWQL